jgi:hypothetical protein
VQSEPELRQAASEQVWLVSHFLFKKDAPGLFLRAPELPPAAELVQTIRACFEPKRPGPKAAANREDST